jgi:divalent metal cation (Fe/Co/Zn/Cd) transporter
VKLGYGFGDPLGAAVVGLVMLYISIELLKHSFVVFMDFSPDRATMEAIDKVLKDEQNSKRITRYHKVRARIAGSRILVDLHIHVPHGTPIENAHMVAHEIESRILREVPIVKEVSIHAEPD